MKKILALGLSFCLCLGLLSACGDSTSSATTAASSQEAATSQVETTETSTQEETAAASFTTTTEGVLTMATNAYFPPYEYYEGDSIVGIDADIAAAIAEKLGLTLKIEDMEFDSIVTAVSTGKADLGLAGMTVTEDRLKNVNFSTSYATGVQSVIVKEDSDIATLDDLAGKLIGVQLATTGDIYATDDFGEEFVEQYNKGNDAIMSLVSGKIDAVIIDNEPAKRFVAANEGLKILDTEYAVEDYAACIAKENTGLLEAVNQALAELQEDGTLQSIVDKYISAE
jgi:polar amino acid transport system substrate-binding protein